ncbi:flagellar hook-basal body protein [Mucisphaera sp.]|uniref:flagellar hook-basal body protein n=1 Tax=Mucisphaera sp. TaxID=2913024 RepID=UPI003D0EC48B
MNYGLYLSASGMLTNMYRLDVFSNNLANAQTTGFKEVIPEIMQRDPERIEDGLGPDVANHLLEKLGGGVLAAPQRIGFGSGQPIETGRSLDVMLTQEDEFFVVENIDAETGEAGFLLTRDGNFTINSRGELVNSAGRRVLDANDRPIFLTESPDIQITDSGLVIQDQEEIADIQVTRVEDRSAITMHGGNLMRLSDPELRTGVADPLIKSGYLESSGVNMFKALMSVTRATGSANSNSRMIRYHDLLMDRAVNTFGRIA